MKLADLLMSLDAMTNILVEWDKAEHGGIVCDTQAYIAMAGDSALSEDTMSADVTGIQVCVNKTINSEYDSACGVLYNECVIGLHITISDNPPWGANETLEDCTARRDGKYRVGDRVYAPHFGEGIITEIDDRKTPAYPIEVQWEHVIPPYHSWHDCFTLDGQYTTSASDPEFDITPLEAIKVSECLKEGKKK